MLFVDENSNDDTHLHGVASLPSVEEIITKISQLQNSWGFIDDLQVKKQALKVLKSAAD